MYDNTIVFDDNGMSITSITGKKTIIGIGNFRTLFKCKLCDKEIGWLYNGCQPDENLKCAMMNRTVLDNGFLCDDCYEWLQEQCKQRVNSKE